MSTSKLLGALGTMSVLGACSVMPPQEFPRESRVDVDRYMGDWYVIAHIPPSKTENAYNSVETYTRGDGNKINTRFTFREGSFTGEEQEMNPTGFVQEESNGAVWGMQLIWPVRMEYTISHVSPDYQNTIVARSARDYVWIMAREPMIDPSTYDMLVNKVASLGYDTSKLRRVPQQSMSERNDR